MHYVNQPSTSGDPPTLASVDAPSGLTCLHEYRIDWIADKTVSYTDNQHMATLESNVPNAARTLDLEQLV